MISLNLCGTTALSMHIQYEIIEVLPYIGFYFHSKSAHFSAWLTDY
jgi:hypothetical protein